MTATHHEAWFSCGSTSPPLLPSSFHTFSSLVPLHWILCDQDKCIPTPCLCTLRSCLCPTKKLTKSFPPRDSYLPLMNSDIPLVDMQLFLPPYNLLNSIDIQGSSWLWLPLPSLITGIFLYFLGWVFSNRKLAHFLGFFRTWRKVECVRVLEHLHTLTTAHWFF